MISSRQVPWWFGAAIFLFVAGGLVLEVIQDKRARANQSETLVELRQITQSDIIGLKATFGRMPNDPTDKAGLVKALQSIAPFRPYHRLPIASLNVLTKQEFSSMGIEINVYRQSSGMSEMTAVICARPGGKNVHATLWEFSSSEFVEWVKAAGLMD